MPTNRSGTRDMPRKKKPIASDTSGKSKQFNIRLSPSYAARLEGVAETLGLDTVSLIRTIVHEKLIEYEARAEAARGAARAPEAKPPK